VFVTGYSTGLISGIDFATIAYDAGTGAVIWRKRYNGLVDGSYQPANGPDYATAIAVSPDGTKVFVSGRSFYVNTQFRIVTYNAGTGTELWNRRIGVLDRNRGAEAVAVSPDSSKVFVTGYDRIGAYDFIKTVAWNAGGGLVWTHHTYTPCCSDEGPDRGAAVAVSPDGTKVFVTGYRTGSTTGIDIATYALDAGTGTQLWMNSYLGNGDDYGRAIAVSPDGTKVFVTGYSTESTSGTDYRTIAYNVSDGAEAWNNSYNGPGNGSDDAQAVAVSADGTEVLVTGTSAGSTTGTDYATLAYDPGNGDTMFTRRYNGPGNGSDGAQAAAVSPDNSKVFVTGTSTGSTGTDFATLAYSTT
jgi:hypothetical protein